ncbi:DNA-sulfur modification-associated [Marinobacter antarcticus]|uniref:DNA-sulfur modification-associated n=1 Tax=Marinobacter antarcticus TaxID=564117 RepID=A0A1M6U832_9GAMM|nr:DNA sulfur modification protein DndB [Marinobacter antarcticus]SHK65334.1 DNA-sulfur modification-associated [Marinobacter antarcticus]
MANTNDKNSENNSEPSEQGITDVQASDLGFDLELVGNFGRFVSSQSYPIEYFMASMPMAQANRYLKFASDVQMDDIDFDLLMQRDIDEERVEKEIIPYLRQDDQPGSTRPLFFPPLLAAIVPVRDNKIEKFYGAKEMTTPIDGYRGVKWSGHFQVYGLTTDSPDGLSLTVDEQSQKIKSRQALLNLRTEENFGDGVMLIVIDGQHRLSALKKLYKRNINSVKNLIVPLCIVYPPNSHLGTTNDETTPTVPRVFRNLFVDVNSTMRVVGGHFNILLSDKTVGDISCRVFCDTILKDVGRTGLSVIEWNTRSAKESFNITKKYTSTSIGIIQKGMEENFKPNMLVNYLLDITEGSEDLFPEGASREDFYPNIKWDSFSYAQSNAIKERVKLHVVPLLQTLYFESVPFKELFDIFSGEIEKLKEEQTQETQAGIAAQAVLHTVLEYKPLNLEEPDFRSRMAKFVLAIESKRKVAKLDIAQYALFQRALFSVAGEIIRFGLKYEVAQVNAYKGFIALIDSIFLRDRSVFDHDQSYLQFTAFDQRRIRAREDTKLTFRDLILAHLLDPDIRAKVVQGGFSSLDNPNPLSADLLDRGFSAAGGLLSRFREERGKAFRKSYEFDYSLTQEEREDLKLKEMTQKSHEREVKEGTREEHGFIRDFDIAVDDYIENFFVDAKKQLKDRLGIQGDLLPIENEKDATEGEES